MTFLTLEDPNAKVKGYRDPLGVQPIWAKFGRHLVTNLTTQTTSVRGFTTLLLGRYFAQRLFESGTIQSEDALDVFLRMEQVGAYVRHAAHSVEGGIRGIERVKRNLGEGGKVAIGSNSQCMILSDQKVYGLWGLYTVSARVSGLIPVGPLGVEPIVVEFIESQYMGFIEPARTKVDRLLAQGGKLDVANRDAVFSAFEPVMREELTPDELEFYGKYLADATKADDQSSHLQQRFRSLLDDQVRPNETIGRAALTRIYEASKMKHKDIADKIDRIIALESLLATADALFQHVLTKNNQDPLAVAAEVRNRWGRSVPNIDPARTADLLAEINQVQSVKVTDALERCGHELGAGDYASAIRSVCNWNAEVMKKRNSGAWVAINDSGKIDVRYNGAEQRLPDGDELGELWRNGYFINSLQSISAQLKVGV